MLLGKGSVVWMEGRIVTPFRLVSPQAFGEYPGVGDCPTFVAFPPMFTAT